MTDVGLKAFGGWNWKFRCEYLESLGRVEPARADHL